MNTNRSRIRKHVLLPVATLLVLVTSSLLRAQDDRIPVFVKCTVSSDGFTDPDSHHAKSMQDSTNDLLKALKAIKISSPIRLVEAEKDAVVVLEVLDRDTKSTGSVLWGQQNKSSLTLRLTAGKYSTEFKGESGMRGRTTGYSAAASKAVNLVENWVAANHDRLMAH
jgi:hypothetical protein